MVSAVRNRTIGVNLVVLRSVAQTVSLRLIGHKLTVCATTICDLAKRASNNIEWLETAPTVSCGLLN